MLVAATVPESTYMKSYWLAKNCTCTQLYSHKIVTTWWVQVGNGFYMTQNTLICSILQVIKIIHSVRLFLLGFPASLSIQTPLLGCRLLCQTVSLAFCHCRFPVLVICWDWLDNTELSSWKIQTPGATEILGTSVTLQHHAKHEIDATDMTTEFWIFGIMSHFFRHITSTSTPSRPPWYICGHPHKVHDIVLLVHQSVPSLWCRYSVIHCRNSEYGAVQHEPVKK